MISLWYFTPALKPVIAETSVQTKLITPPQPGMNPEISEPTTARMKIVR